MANRLQVRWRVHSNHCHGESLQQMIGLLPTARFCHGQTNIGIEPIFRTAESESFRRLGFIHRARWLFNTNRGLPWVRHSNPEAHTSTHTIVRGASEAYACPIRRLVFSIACPIQSPPHSTHRGDVLKRTHPEFHFVLMAYACPFWATCT